MKKLRVKLFSMILLLALIVCPAIKTQSQEFEVGDKLINAGVGFGATWYSGTYYKTSLPPIFVSADIGFKDDIGPGVLGLGGYLGMSSYKYEYTWLGGSWGWKYTSVVIGARGTYHYELVDNLDTYGGVLLGVRILSSKVFGDEQWITGTASGSGLAYSFFVGGRYFFSDNFGVMAELGYGIAWLSVGVTIGL
jgi:hypothetical protein